MLWFHGLASQTVALWFDLISNQSSPTWVSTSLGCCFYFRPDSAQIPAATSGFCWAPVVAAVQRWSKYVMPKVTWQLSNSVTTLIHPSPCGIVQRVGLIWYDVNMALDFSLDKTVCGWVLVFSIEMTFSPTLITFVFAAASLSNCLSQHELFQMS